MLKFFFQTTEISCCSIILVFLIFALLRQLFHNRFFLSKIICVIASVIAALAFTIVKLNTRLINRSTWNLRSWYLSFAAFVFAFIFLFLTKKQTLEKRKTLLVVFENSTLYSFLLLVFCQLFYYLPLIFELPHTILLTDESVFSSSFIIKNTGCFFGIILSFIAGLASYKFTRVLSFSQVRTLTFLVIFITSSKQIFTSFGILLSKRIIKRNHTMFVISKYTNLFDHLFIYLTLALCLFYGIMVFIRSLNVNEPYENSAQRRKIIAKWRKIRRWLLCSLLSFLLIVITISLLKKVANKVVELSPIEPCLTENGNMYVPFDRVSDGHLHRFGYTCQSGKTVRFIVIKKPNSSAYGVGLDACEICGETGYYEKEDQIVCNLCDVVMNINTIGFKGGCNPIVIKYSIEDGNIVVPVSELEKNEFRFKR